MSLDKLLTWSSKEFNHLPWRQNRTLYRTLVSEIMLQQTTVSTVLNHFERFLNEFPDLFSLAKATEEELLIAWKGLGYYRRARNLKKIAEYLVEEFKGIIPIEYQTLVSIPGIGPYTANAIIAIGNNKKALAIDANLERVISRLYGIKTPRGPKLGLDINQRFSNGEIFQETKKYRALNEALMDLGRTNCQARKSSCELCLLRANCIAFKEKKVLSYPVELKEKKPSVEHDLDLLRIVVKKKNLTAVYLKNKSEWLSGQYEIPTFSISTTDKKFEQYPKTIFDLENLPTLKTSITKYRIKNFIVEMNVAQFNKMKFPREVEWVEIGPKSNISTASKKVLDIIKNRDQE